jgi:hypothetical protein
MDAYLTDCRLAKSNSIQKTLHGEESSTNLHQRILRVKKAKAKLEIYQLRLIIK